jgi:hypothetical protein
MRFLLPDPLGNDKHSMMFHTAAFAIAAGVVGVGAAGASAAISMSAADRAKRAQGAAAKSFKQQQGKAVARLERGQKKVGKMIQQVEAPVYNPESMISDAAKFSAANRAELEKFLPDAEAGRARQMQLINQAMGVLQEGLKGGYGQDVADQTMRSIAEFGGAGFNLATAGRTGGFQAMQGLVPRQFGELSTDVQYRALAALPQVSNVFATWNSLADAFNVKGMDVGKLQLGYQGAAAEVGLQKARMTGDMFSNIFNAQSGLATQIYGANKESAAASYAAQQAVGEGIGRVGRTGADAFMTGAQISAAQQGLNLGGMGGGMGGAGGYASMGQAQQAAPYASSISQVYGSGYVPRATAV